MACLVELGSRRRVFAGERINTGVYQELLRQYVVPWAQRTQPDEKYAFWRIRCRPTSVGRILDTDRLATIFAGLLYLQRYAGKMQTIPYGNPAALCLSIAMEWDWLVVE